MNYLWWTLTLLLMLLGWAGTLLPFLPGTTVILAAAVLQHFTVRGPRAASWQTVAWLAGLTALSYLVDLVSGTVGAKWLGATRWGAIGGMVGTVVGLFYGFVGVFVFPLAGVLIGELLGGKELLPAGKSTLGTLIGTGVGLVIRCLIGAAMIVWFLLATR